MTDNPTSKVVQLVVNKDVPKQPGEPSIEITLGAKVKYFDEEVVLVKVHFDIAGQVSRADHIVVQAPKK